MAWHNGKWKPVYVPQWYSPNVSNYPFDPYSFTHILHGVLLFYAWQWIGLQPTTGFLAMLCFELIWEIVENGEKAIERYRRASGTSKDYLGDSYQNILGDLTACQAGYVLSYIFNLIKMPWLSILWYLGTEVYLLAYMRDNLTLTFITLIFPNEKISKWQNDGVERAREEEKKSKQKHK